MENIKTFKVGSEYRVGYATFTRYGEFAGTLKVISVSEIEDQEVEIDRWGRGTKIVGEITYTLNTKINNPKNKRTSNIYKYVDVKDKLDKEGKYISVGRNFRIVRLEDEL